TVVLITHKLDEVIAISDEITVMRSGRTVERIRTADTTPGAIARAMVGRDVALALDHLGVGGGGGGAGLHASGPDASGAVSEAAGERVPPPATEGAGRQQNASAAEAARGAPPENTIGAPRPERAT